MTVQTFQTWSDPEGPITPVPEGITFPGGTNEMPAGNVGKFKADLEPGEYAFISEVPIEPGKNQFTPFKVLARGE